MWPPEYNDWLVRATKIQNMYRGAEQITDRDIGIIHSLKTGVNKTQKVNIQYSCLPLMTGAVIQKCLLPAKQFLSLSGKVKLKSDFWKTGKMKSI